LDGSKAVLAVVRDITERVAAERELSMQLAEIFEANESLRQITADLRASEAALKRVSRQLSILNSITRHDVLNQATIISGYSSIMREDLVEQSQKDMAEKINRSAEVIRHQMEFAKMYQGIGVEAPTWHPLSRCVEKAAASLEMGGLRVIDLCGEYSVRADPMFEKVIYNLLDNCLRHSKGASRIWFRVSEEAGNLVLTVRDDGHGISAGDREHLFERGYGKNSGYGLFLSREILGITGISIEEKSGPGEGAAFVITIPPEDWKRA
jgi:signal transduction histidine kinase